MATKKTAPATPAPASTKKTPAPSAAPRTKRVPPDPPSDVPTNMVASLGNRKTSQGYPSLLQPLLILPGQTILLNPDKVLRKEKNGWLGHHLYMDCLAKDPSYAGMVEARMAAVLDLQTIYEPWDTSPQATQELQLVQEVIENVDNWPTFLENAYLYQFITGRSFHEPEWVPRDYAVGGLPVHYGIQRMWSRSVDRFVFDINSNPRLRTSAFTYDSIKIHPRGIALWQNRPTDERPYGFGVGEAVYYHVEMKQNASVFWAVLSDKWAQPTAVMKYKAGTKTKAEVDDLTELVESISQRTGLVLPDNIVLELLEAKNSGEVKTLRDFVTWLDSMIAMRVMSHTGSNDMLSAPGIHVGDKNGSAQNRMDTVLIARDARHLCHFLQYQIVRPIIDVNYGARPATQYPRVCVKSARPTDMATEIAVDAALKAIGCGPNMGIEDRLKYYGRPSTLPKNDTALGPASPTGAEVGQPVGTGSTSRVTGQPESVRQRQPGEPKKPSLEEALRRTLVEWAANQ